MIKTYGYIFYFFFFFLILIPQPTYPSNLYKYHQVAMGTVIEITLIADDEEASNKAAFRAFQEDEKDRAVDEPED
jgi:hypothetical protein